MFKIKNWSSFQSYKDRQPPWIRLHKNLLDDYTFQRMGAGESILGASIGSGVAAGASTGLGHSDAANIASGIIGGVTGRTVGRVLQNRRTRNQNVINEQTPLLQTTGNRLGGSGNNRLIADIQDPNIPRPNVPAPGEPTQTRNPFTHFIPLFIL